MDLPFGVPLHAPRGHLTAIWYYLQRQVYRSRTITRDSSSRIRSDLVWDLGHDGQSARMPSGVPLHALPGRLTAIWYYLRRLIEKYTGELGARPDFFQAFSSKAQKKSE